MQNYEEQINLEDAQNLVDLTKKHADRFFKPTLLELVAYELNSVYFVEYEEFKEFCDKDLAWLINKHVMEKNVVGLFQKIQTGRRLEKHNNDQMKAVQDTNWQYMRLGFGKFASETFGHNFVIEIWPPKLSSGYHHHGKTIGAVTLVRGKLKAEEYDLKPPGTDYTKEQRTTSHLEFGQTVSILPDEGQIHNVTNVDPEDQCSLSLHGYIKPRNVEATEFGMIQENDSSKEKLFQPKCDYCKYVTREIEHQSLGTELTIEFLNLLIWEEITNFGRRVPKHQATCPFCQKTTNKTQVNGEYNYECENQQCQIKWLVEKKSGKKRVDPNSAQKYQNLQGQSIYKSIFRLNPRLN